MKPSLVNWFMKQPKKLGGLDTLVLNAGMQQAVKDIKELTTQQIQDTFTTNIISMYWTVKKHWIAPAGGSIITTTSIKVRNQAPIF